MKFLNDTIIFLICIILIIYLIYQSYNMNIFKRVYGYTLDKSKDTILFIHKNIVAVLFLLAIGMMIYF